MKNNLSKPRKKRDNVKNRATRGTRVRGKEAQCGRKEMTDVEALDKSHEDFNRQISFD